MSGWTLVYSRQAQNDARKLVGNLAGCFSRRITIQRRFVYEVLPDQHVVHILRMWTFYE